MAKSELTKYAIEARENVRFLQTLERHFKNLQHTTDFNVIYDTIPSMMNSLRMVWIISRLSGWSSYAVFLVPID